MLARAGRIREPVVLDVLLLVFRQRQSDDVDVVLLDRAHDGGAPAAADVEQRHPGLQTQLAERQVDLGPLCLFERHVVALEYAQLYVWLGSCQSLKKSLEMS